MMTTGFKHHMILSASGWRKVFARSNREQDFTREIGTENYVLSILAAESFAEYLCKKALKQIPTIVVGQDSRPTGAKICDAILKALKLKNIEVRFLGIAAAPEIMAYSKSADGFIYVSASHNPVGHNGIKFGLSDGGVLNAEENNIVKEIFLKKIKKIDDVYNFKSHYDLVYINDYLNNQEFVKSESLAAYEKFSEEVISASMNQKTRYAFFKNFDRTLQNNKIGIVCDFNGSARASCIDAKFFKKHGLNFYPVNDVAGCIDHEIIPEPENLIHAKRHLERTRAGGCTDAILGYMCDCDGDRGNLVYWSNKNNCVKILKAQEVFSLSVLAELSYMTWIGGKKAENMAVAVNCPTSMRIDEIAKIFNARIFRAEVGEANVVNLARALMEQGYNVRILGEGSNGGTITYPASVRDPLNTVFAIIKLLAIKDSLDKNGQIKKGLFHLWCEKRNIPYNEKFTLDDVIDSLPVYTTTGVSENRAILKINMTDHTALKRNFQTIFENSFYQDSEGLRKKYNITGFKASVTNGTKEIFDAVDFSLSGKGGLKILFYENNSSIPASYIWMRGSGTEPVFRVLCDVKGDNAQKEKDLLAWETKLLQKADV